MNLDYICIGIYVMTNISFTAYPVKTRKGKCARLLEMTDHESTSELVKLHMALADPTRLRLLNLMRAEEVCVCFFTEVLGESQPKISRHLAYLRKLGIVEARRDGKWMHYRIAEFDDHIVADVLESTLDALWSQEEMKDELEKLEAVCCAPDAPVTIARAPKPEAFAEAENLERESGELATFLL